MSKLNTSKRKFETKFQRSTVLHPTIQANKTPRDWQATARDYIDVPTIATRGTWPVVHLISDETLIRMGVASGQIDKGALSLLGGK